MSEQELDEKIVAGELFSSHIFSRLAKHFTLEERVENKERKKAAELAQTIHGFLGNQYYYKAEEETIQKLCRWGALYPETYSGFWEQDAFLKRYIEAALYFKERGFEMRIEGGEIYFDDAMGQQFFDMLDMKIATVGGSYVLEKVFMEHINERYLPEMDRYILSRNVDKKQNVPLNLLINLAVKHLKARAVKKPEAEIRESLDEIFELAEAWLEISGIQGESGMEYSMLGVDQFPVYLKNEMIFDKMCVPVQYSKRFILLSLDYLIKPWFDDWADRQYSYKEYRKAAEYILGLCAMGAYIDIEDMKRKTGISRYRLKAILMDISQEAKDVNVDFVSLDSHTNWQQKPLIRFPMETYFFLDQHFCGMGFYHAAYEMIKKNQPILDRLQGTVVETMLLDEMKAKGYDCKYGHYPEQNGINEDECDLVLEGKRLNFFEIKKRLSIDEFDLVDDVSLLRGLSLGMVKAQRQCFAHERYLRKNGALALDTGKESFTVTCDRDKLPAYKISVCFSEYSFLTSKSFCLALMEVLMLGEFKAVDASRQSELDVINKVAAAIRSYAVEMTPPKLHDAKSMSFFSLFCSLQQILTAVWLCDTQEEFLEAVRDWLYAVDRTLDPYISLFETRHYQKNPEKPSIRKSAIEMLEKSQPYAMFVGD